MQTGPSGALFPCAAFLVEAELKTGQEPVPTHHQNLKEPTALGKVETSNRVTISHVQVSDRNHPALTLNLIQNAFFVPVD